MVEEIGAIGAIGSGDPGRLRRCLRLRPYPR